MALSRSALVLGVLSIVACSAPPAPPSGAPSASAPAPASAPDPPPAAPAAPVVPSPGAAVDSNPLHLPPHKLSLDAGKRVFAVSEQMLATTRIGSTLVLYASTVVGLDGDDLILESKGGPSYKLQASYAIAVPDDPKITPGDAVVTEWNGVMKHAVVTKLVKDRVGVRYTDMDSKLPELLLLGGRGAPGPSGPSKTVRMMKQVEGLVPGNFAALKQGADWLHVLLVSPSGEGADKRWFALGFGGAAMVVSEADLKAIPVKWSPKVGATVWAEWAGSMRRATVQSADEQGVFTVKYERAGRPATVGWGLLMAPVP